MYLAATAVDESIGSTYNNAQTLKKLLNEWKVNKWQEPLIAPQCIIDPRLRISQVRSGELGYFSVAPIPKGTVVMVSRPLLHANVSAG